MNKERIVAQLKRYSFKKYVTNNIAILFYLEWVCIHIYLPFKIQYIHCNAYLLFQHVTQHQKVQFAAAFNTQLETDVCFVVVCQKKTKHFMFLDLLIRSWLKRKAR